ncbi:MAG: hypothetical protein ACI8RD_012756, partial [Bacillariaceae sp.]
TVARPKIRPSLSLYNQCSNGIININININNDGINYPRLHRIIDLSASFSLSLILP